MEYFKFKISEIIADKYSGSTTILNNTLNALIDLYRDSDQIDENQLINQLNRLFQAHNNLVILFHLINCFFAELENNKAGNRLSFLIDYKNKWSDSLTLACQHAINEIDFKEKHILLHSNTTAIYTLFQQLDKLKIYPTIFQAASSPLNEGKIQAELLSKLSYKVKYINENNVGNFIQHIDFATFGADLIADKLFLNKAGTLPITLTLNHFNKPVYVISDTRKVISKNLINKNPELDLFYEKEKPPDELWEKPPKNVEPANYYFEQIPTELITRFFTEKGSFTPASINSISTGFDISNLLNLDKMQNGDFKH